jgi:hypothetical protein
MELEADCAEMWRSGQSRRRLFSRRAATMEDLLQDHAAVVASSYLASTTPSMAPVASSTLSLCVDLF